MLTIFSYTCNHHFYNQKGIHFFLACSCFLFICFQYFCFHGTTEHCGFPSSPFLGGKAAVLATISVMDHTLVTPQGVRAGGRAGSINTHCATGWWISLPDAFCSGESRQPALLINTVISRRAWLWGWVGLWELPGHSLLCIPHENMNISPAVHFHLCLSLFMLKAEM